MSTLKYILDKYKIEVGKQYYIDVPNMYGSADLAKLFAELKFSKGVEIGTDEGIYAEYLLKTIPNLQLYCIDPWRAEAYEPGEQPESGETQDFFDMRYKQTVGRLWDYREKCFLVRETSMGAVEGFDNNSLDFVYIDGNHDFLNVIQDIQFWLKKIKPGGIIAGHDYVNYPFRKYNHVKNAVQSYARSYHLLPVFAVLHTKEGLRRDRYRSWFIVKQ